jgi:ectoine hydroxylase-related dioxygenase (phytanoyl-CoA dioxygenase family)
MTNTEPLRPVTAEERSTFASDGAICLRGLFDLEWVELLRDATEELMAHPTALSIDHNAATGKFFSAIYVWRDNAGFKDFEFRSPLGRVCANLMGSSSARLYHDHLLVKEPGTDAPTPWHQDQPYFRTDGSQLCSLWFALDAVDKDSGGVQFVKGSHRWGWFDPNIFKPGETEASEFPQAPDIAGNLDEYEILSWDLEPGDCTVHHGLTFHGAWPNRSAERRRRGHSVRIAGDDVTYASRKKSHALPLDPGLKPGDRLESDLFPQVWPRSSD